MIIIQRFTHQGAAALGESKATNDVTERIQTLRTFVHHQSRFSRHTLAHTPAAVRLKTTHGNLFPKVAPCRGADEAGALLPPVKHWCIITEEVDFHLKITPTAAAESLTLRLFEVRINGSGSCLLCSDNLRLSRQTANISPLLIRKFGDWIRPFLVWYLVYHKLGFFCVSQQRPSIGCDACPPPISYTHVGLKQLAAPSGVLHHWYLCFHAGYQILLSVSNWRDKLWKTAGRNADWKPAHRIKP